MKRLILIPLLLINLLLQATNYHVKTGGDDEANGDLIHPWATIDKVNTVWTAGTFAPGDSICFNRGDTFYGTITPKESGTSGNQIIIGAYGTGDDPIITGFTTLSSWTSEGGSIYSKAVTSEALTNMVTVNGVYIGMGRYPDSDWKTFESSSTNISITDNELGAEGTDWDGAEAVIWKNPWTIDRTNITDNTGNLIVYTSIGGTESSYATGKYFIQNDLRCVTATNEWYHDVTGGKLFIYGDPAAKVVKVATLNYLFYNVGYDYITIDGVNFAGAILSCISNTSTVTNLTIKNCNVSFAGKYGIYGNGGSVHTIDNNTVSYTHSAGIYSILTTNYTITNNIVSYSGVIAGGSTLATYDDGIYAGYGNTCTVQYNTISYTGYNGIYFAGNSVNVKNNLISYSCQILNDGGGIYVGGAAYTGRLISGNIILYSGAGNVLAPQAEGVYLDESAANIIVEYNTIAHCNYAGIKLHKSSNNIIRYNISYNNGFGIFLQESVNGSVISNTVEYNQFVAKAPTQYALYAYSVVDNIPSFFASADHNYYMRPYDDSYVMRTRQLATGYVNKTLAEWQTLISDEANSAVSPIGVTDTSKIDFYYNASSTPLLIDLTGDYIDITGRKIDGVLDTTIAAWTSVILMEDPNPDPPAFPVVTQTFTYSTVRHGVIASVVSGDDVGTISAKGICWNTTGNPTIAANVTDEGVGIGIFNSTFATIASTTYYVRTYATNESGTAYSSIIVFTTPVYSPAVSGGKIQMIKGKRAVIY